MSDYEKLKNIIDEIDILINNPNLTESPQFRTWRTKAERIIVKLYGDKSLEHIKFIKTRCYPYGWGSNTNFCECYRKDLEELKMTFEYYLDELKEKDGEQNMNEKKYNYSKVFIVHGHDGELKHAVARTIEKQGLQAVILSEQVNKGRTIIKKFEENSDVCGAVCLFTADDVGKAKTEATEQPRARQNVVFEAGYFMGKLGRDHVVMICEDGVEIPGDLSGVVYTGKNNWQIDMLKELKAMGYSIDMNKLFY